MQTLTPTTPRASPRRSGRRSARRALLSSARIRRSRLALREAESQPIAHNGSETPDTNTAVSMAIQVTFY